MFRLALACLCPALLLAGASLPLSMGEAESHVRNLHSLAMNMAVAEVAVLRPSQPMVYRELQRLKTDSQKEFNSTVQRLRKSGAFSDPNFHSALKESVRADRETMKQAAPHFSRMHRRDRNSILAVGQTVAKMERLLGQCRPARKKS